MLLAYEDRRFRYHFGVDPVAVAQSLKAKYGDNLCFYIIDLSDNKHGQQVLKAGLSVTDDPLIVRGSASRPFDGEGITGKRLAMIEDGVLVEALLAASVHGVREVQFELTEPVVFEFDGRPKEQIVGTGTLTVNSSVYPLGAPLPFCRPMTRSCSSRTVRSQDSMSIRMRR